MIIFATKFLLCVLIISFLYQLNEFRHLSQVETVEDQISDDDDIVDEEGTSHVQVFTIEDLNPNFSFQKSKQCERYYFNLPTTIDDKIHDGKILDRQRKDDEVLCQNILSDKIKNAYENDGVVAIRGLLSPSLINGIQDAASILTDEEWVKLKRSHRPRNGRQFHTTKMGAIFLQDEEDKLKNKNRSLTFFQEVALRSILPQISAELLGINNQIPQTNGAKSFQKEKLRILRDVFLAKDDDAYICGWHVDDLGFWPASAKSTGVNAWIALDDMPSELGGTFAVSVGSHKADWRHKAYEITGATPTFPEEGFKSAEDMVINREGYGTCNIKNAAPEIYSKLEHNKRVYDLEAGDVIFHTRWLFHRTIPFSQKVVKKNLQSSKKPLLNRRYSIRYVSGSTKLPRGWSGEWSILVNQDNAGRTLDEVAEFDSPWYPMCWPEVDTNEMSSLGELIQKRLPLAQRLHDERMKEIKHLLKRNVQSSRVRQTETEL